MENIDKRIMDLVPYLKKRAQNMTFRSSVEADDLFQETFIKIWSNKDSYVYEGSLKAWCLTIMHNVCIDLFKKTSSITYLNLNDEFKDDEDIGMSCRNIDTLKEESSAEGSITIDDIYDTIEEVLSTKEMTIVMKSLDGFKQKEIGEELNIKSNNVKQRYFQAIRKVRIALTDKFDLDPEFGERLIEVYKKNRSKKE